MKKKTFFPLISTFICFTLFPAISDALPKHSKTAAGSASFEVNNHVMEIKTSDQTVLHYSSFDIGKGEKVKFIQNSSKSCVLNKVTGKDPSKILGNLESNGKVFLVNPNGVYFGVDSKVNVGSLIVSTLHIEDEDFLSGKYEFHLKDQISSIQNEGSLLADESVAFISPQIQNKGLIEARATVFTSGKHVALDFTGDGLIQFSVEGSLKESLIEHLGEIQSSHVSMKISAAKKAVSEIVNLDGIEVGEVFTEENGVIKLSSTSYIKADHLSIEAGFLDIKGNVDSSNSLDKGGEIGLFGTKILVEGAVLDASGRLGGGKVLIGGEFQGKGSTPYSVEVNMTSNSQIIANALETGNGGEVVLWSSESTFFDGKITSKGGSLAGSGGLVETSSKNLLTVRGVVDASASKGRQGSWLLDPANLYLNSSNSSLCPSGCPLCDCNLFGPVDTTCASSGNVTACSLFENGECAADLVFSATYGIYIDSTIKLTGKSLTFQPCSNSPGGVLPVFFQNNSEIQTSGNGVYFLNGAYPVINGDILKIDLTHGGHTGGSELIVERVQSLNKTGGLEVKPGTGHFTILSTISSGSTVQQYNADGTASGNLQTTYPPNYVQLDGTVASFQTSGIATSGGFINLNSQAVTLTGSGQIPFNTSGVSSGGGQISMGAIDASSSGAQGVYINAGTGGGLAISGAIGGSIPVGAVTIVGGSSTHPSSLSSSITTQNGNILLSSYFSVTGALSLTANGGTIDTSNASITASAPLSINTSGSLVDLGSINSASTLSISTANGGVSLTSTVTSGAITIAAGTGAISAGTVLTTSSAGSFQTVSGSSLNFSSIQTASGGIQISPVPIQLTQNAILSSVTSGSGGAIDLSTVDGIATGTTELAPSFSISSGSGFLSSGTIGGNHPLGTLTISAGANFAAPNIFTANRSITISSSILLSQNTTFNTVFNAGTGGSITLGDINGSSNYSFTLLAGSQAIQVGTIGSTIGAISMTGGSVTLAGSVTTTDASASLTINNSGILSVQSGNVNLSAAPFNQIGAGETDLFGSITATSLLFMGPVVLIGNSSLTATSSSLTASTITGSFTGTLLASGNISVGTLSVSTNSVTSTSGNISIGSISSTSTDLTASIGSVLVDGTLSASSLTVNAGNGVTVTGAAILSGAASITANGGNVSLGAIQGTSILSVEANSGSISSGSVAASSVEFQSFTSSISTQNVTAENTLDLEAGTSITTGTLSSSNVALNAGTSISSQSITAVNILDLVAGSAITTGALSASNVTLNAGDFISTQNITALNTLDLDAITSITTVSISASNATLDAGTSITTGSINALNSTINAGSSITINGAFLGGGSTLTAGSFVSLTDDAFLDDSLSITAGTSISALGAIEAITGVFSAGSGISVTGYLFHVENATLTSTTGNVSLPQVLSENFLSATLNGGSFSSGIFNAGEATFNVSGTITITGTATVDSSFTVQNASGLIITGTTTADEVILGEGSGTLSGMMAFEGPVTLGELVTTAQNYNVSILNGGEVFSPTIFNNTGLITLQSGSYSILVFDGQLVSSSLPTTIKGAIATTVGGMSFESLNILSGGSSLTTAGDDIEVNGSVTLNGNASFTSLGGDIVFNSTVEGPGGILVSASPGIAQFNQPIGFTEALAYVTAVNVSVIETQGVNAVGTINMNAPILLTGAGSNLFQSQGLIFLGNIDGSSSGVQDLILSGGADISLGNIGQTTPLGTVSVLEGSRVILKSIQTEGSIDIEIDAILGVTENKIVTLNTNGGSSLGADISLKRVDGSTLGGEGLVLNAGFLGEVFLEESVGEITPIGSLTVDGLFLSIQGPLMSIVGNQIYGAPTEVTPSLTSFTTLGSITFESSLDSSSNLSVLVFSMGGGAFNALGDIGDSNMGDLFIFNSGSFSSQQVTAHTLRVSGGLPAITLNGKIDLSGLGGIVLDGGPIFLGGEIDASHVFFRSSASMSNLSSPQPINVEGENPFVLEYFNAMGGPIGSFDNPIEVNTSRSFNLGARRRADFMGTPFQNRFFLVSSNPPCIVTFNGVTVLDCGITPSTQTLFDETAKNLLYVPGIYSSWSWDNLSQDWYFKEEPFHLGKNPRNAPLFYEPRERKVKRVKI